MQSLFLSSAAIGITAFAVSCFTVSRMISYALQLNIVDAPNTTLKTQKAPVPYLGGLGVFLALIATLLVFKALTVKIAWILAGGFVLMAVGLFDDLYVISPSQKFLGQFGAVLLFMFGGITLKAEFFSSAITAPVAMFWMLSVINAFNLIDVMDGLASSVALAALTSFFVIASMQGLTTICFLIAALMGGLLGFLVYNKKPARIYLGDSGSLFIGGILSAIPFFISWSERSQLGILAPILILGVPLAEVVALIIIRSYLKIPFYNGSPHHFSILLRQQGWGWKTIIAFSCCAGLSLGVMALFLIQGALSLPVFAALLSLGSVAWVVLIYRKII